MALALFPGKGMVMEHLECQTPKTQKERKHKFDYEREFLIFEFDRDLSKSTGDIVTKTGTSVKNPDSWTRA